MILSNKEIQKAITSGRLIIDPIPKPFAPEPGASDCPYGTHSVDLRLGNKISIPEPGTFSFDLGRPGSVAATIARHSKQVSLTADQPYILPPGTFILGQTFEKISLPIVEPPYLAARIEGKSSRARCGVLVHFTAPTVHPGFRGFLTLEMINLGPAAFVLRDRMPIAQLIVEQVHGELTENPSQFQDQSSPEGLPSSGPEPT